MLKGRLEGFRQQFCCVAADMVLATDSQPAHVLGKKYCKANSNHSLLALNRTLIKPPDTCLIPFASHPNASRSRRLTKAVFLLARPPGNAHVHGRTRVPHLHSRACGPESHGRHDEQHGLERGSSGYFWVFKSRKSGFVAEGLWFTGRLSSNLIC